MLEVDVRIADKVKMSANYNLIVKLTVSKMT